MDNLETGQSTHLLPALPYDYAAREPHIDARTMRHLKLIAAALAVLALSACAGGAVVVPIPLPSSTTTQDTDRNERR